MLRRKKKRITLSEISKAIGLSSHSALSQYETYKLSSLKKETLDAYKAYIDSKEVD